MFVRMSVPIFMYASCTNVQVLNNVLKRRDYDRAGMQAPGRGGQVRCVSVYLGIHEAMRLWVWLSHAAGWQQFVDPIPCIFCKTRAQKETHQFIETTILYDPKNHNNSIHIYIYISIYVYVFLPVYLYISISIYIHISIYMNIYTYRYTYRYRYKYT